MGEYAQIDLSSFWIKIPAVTKITLGTQEMTQQQRF